MNATLTMEAAIKHAQTMLEVTSAHVCPAIHWMQITRYAVVSYSFTAWKILTH